MKKIWDWLISIGEPEIYRSCSELPLNNFLKCLEGDLSYLVKDRSNHPKLDEIWDKIFIEYVELSKDQTHVRIISLIKEVTQLKVRINYTYHVCTQLRIKHNPDLIKSLKRMGFRNPENIELTLKQNKGLTIKLREKETELANLQKQKGESGNMDELLSELSKFQGYHINTETVTVSRFVAMVNRFKKAIEDGKQRKN